MEANGCTDKRCLKLSDKAIKKMEKRPDQEVVLDPKFGGFAFNFGTSPQETEHYPHIRERTEQKIGRTVFLAMTPRLAGTDMVPTVYITLDQSE